MSLSQLSRGSLGPGWAMSKGTVFDKKGANLPNAVTRGQGCSIYRYDISIIDISTLFENSDINVLWQGVGPGQRVQFYRIIVNNLTISAHSKTINLFQNNRNIRVGTRSKGTVFNKGAKLANTHPFQQSNCRCKQLQIAQCQQRKSAH